MADVQGLVDKAQRELATLHAEIEQRKVQVEAIRTFLGSVAAHQGVPEATSQGSAVTPAQPKAQGIIPARKGRVKRPLTASSLDERLSVPQLVMSLIEGNGSVQSVEVAGNLEKEGRNPTTAYPTISKMLRAGKLRKETDPENGKARYFAVETGEDKGLPEFGSCGVEPEDPLPDMEVNHESHGST